MASTQDATKQAYDLLLVTDATGSMGDFLSGLNRSLPEIISISALTSCFERIGVIAYRDYCDHPVTQWSGWCCPSGTLQDHDLASQDDVLKMAQGLRPNGGGDFPEAAKTGLACAHSKMRPEAITLILLYADAPPHFKQTGGEYWYMETKALSASKHAYGSSDKSFVDWAAAAHLLRHGPKRAIVFPVVSGAPNHSPYVFLSTVTGGNTFPLKSLDANTISRLTVNVLLTWMRLGRTIEEDNIVLANVWQYKDTNSVGKVVSETSGFSNFVATTFDNWDRVKHSIQEQRVTCGTLPDIMKARGPRVSPFAKKYASDTEYRQLAADQLRRLIKFDVIIITVNPIFGSLWRAVCNDRISESRDELVSLFSYHVQNVQDIDEKGRLNKWLEESYNYAAEIDDFINKIPDEFQFPQLYLDPTETFSAGDDGEGKGFTRKELLDIGRSCDFKVLRRIGKALTRLNVAETPEQLPMHIKTASSGSVPRIPTILAKSQYGRKFWRVLLHAILPGTLLSERAAALLAALSLRMGISHLQDVADAELLHFRDKWNSLKVPETWSLGCLSLILEADKNYEKRVDDGKIAARDPQRRILSENDRNLFKTLVDYKLLDLNMDTTLRPRVAWQPYKDKSALGPLIVCRVCDFPRSVTIMAKDGICGICAAAQPSGCSCTACQPGDDHAACQKANVSREMTPDTTANWVECKNNACRAQYVVYNVDLLHFTSKCFFCRHTNDAGRAKFGQAPVVECHKCLSRVIWPPEYRPINFDTTSYECAACLHGTKTITERETSARHLVTENGIKWLLRNDDNIILQPLDGKSIFSIVSTCDLANLATNLSILPDMDTHLTVSGRTVHNVAQVRGTLREWVYSRRVEQGICSLCFEDGRKNMLVRACGRKGCEQLICEGCRQDWYGINQRGRIINIAALSCPFCRRRPTRKAIHSFPFAYLEGLQRAIDFGGRWIYAWCTTCDVAKRYMERVCANGAPDELADWKCGRCLELEARARTHQRLEIEARAQQDRSRKCNILPPRPCPQCGVWTEKTGGCNHITCPCGANWCYICGEQSADHAIYEHIAINHMGVAWEEDDDDYNGW